MLRSFFLLLFFSFLGAATLSGQTSTPLDSLIAACDAYTKEDTVKVKMLIQIAGEYQKIAPKSGIKTAEEAIVLARRIGNPFLLAEACNKKGANLSGIGMIDEAIPCFEEASHLFETAGAPKRVAAMLGNIGIMYNYKRDFDNAILYFEKALKAQKSLEDWKGVANTLGYIGIEYVHGRLPQGTRVSRQCYCSP